MDFKVASVECMKILHLIPSNPVLRGYYLVMANNVSYSRHTPKAVVGELMQSKITYMLAISQRMSISFHHRHLPTQYYLSSDVRYLKLDCFEPRELME